MSSSVRLPFRHSRIVCVRGWKESNLQFPVLVAEAVPRNVSAPYTLGKSSRRLGGGAPLARGRTPV